MDAFWECSIDNNIRKGSDVFTSKFSQSEVSLSVPDKRFKLKQPSNNASNTIDSQLAKQHQQLAQNQANADLLKLNLNNKKELKKKLLNFDINRNFEDIYWLSLKDKPIRSSSNSNFPPIFDKNFFKPKHGMNNYQLIKFENRYQQQLLQQQQPQQNKPNGSKSKKEKKYSVTESISKTAAVLVDLNRQSLSSLHSMPIVNENFRNRYFENYLHNRKLSIAHSSNNVNSNGSGNSSKSQSRNNNQSTNNTHNNAENNNNNNSNNNNNNSKDNNKQIESHSNKNNDTNLTSLNTIYFKPNFNLAENGSSHANSFDSDDEKLAGSPICKNDQIDNSQNKYSNNPQYSIRQQSKKRHQASNFKRSGHEEPVAFDDGSKVVKDDLQFQFRLKPLTESTLTFTPDDHNDSQISQLSQLSQVSTPKRNTKRDSGIRAPKQSIQESFESLSKKIAESLPSSNSKTKLSKLNQYGKETKMEENNHTIVPSTTNLALTANIPASTPQPTFKKPKPIIDVKSRKQSSLEAQQKNETLMINNKKTVMVTADLKPKVDGQHFGTTEDFNYLRVESPHKLGKAAGDCYKFIATSSVQVNSSNSFKNMNKQNQFDSFQSNFYENTKSSINKTA